MIRKSRGFTLMEMMVAMAIVGILAAIALDAYNKSVRRAKTRIAKTYLSTAYGAEMTFLVEHQSFTHCLRQIKGFPGEPQLIGPDPTPRQYFIGFVNGGDGTCGPTRDQSCYAYRFNPTLLSCTCGAVAAGGSNDCTADTTLNPSVLTDAAAYTWTAAQDTFTVGAVGWIGGPRLDVWTIDQTKTLTNVQSGE